MERQAGAVGSDFQAVTTADLWQNVQQPVRGLLQAYHTLPYHTAPYHIAKD